MACLAYQEPKIDHDWILHVECRWIFDDERHCHGKTTSENRWYPSIGDHCQTLLVTQFGSHPEIHRSHVDPSQNGVQDQDEDWPDDVGTVFIALDHGVTLLSLLFWRRLRE